MLLEAFNKQIKPELKDAYQTYGDKLVRTVINDIAAYNKSVHRIHKLSRTNINDLRSMLKQVAYITSYYVRASEDRTTEDITFMVMDKWRTYSNRMDTLLKKKIAYKDKKIIVMNYMKLIICVACLADNDYINTYNYSKSRKTEDFTRDVIEKVGYQYFYSEMMIQCYILSAMKGLLQLKTYNNKYLRVYRMDNYVDHLYNVLLSPKGFNYNLSMNKVRLYRKMKEFGYMKFKPLQDANYSLMINEIFDKDNNMCKCMDEVENFLYNMNIIRDDKKVLEMSDIRVLGVI